MNRVVWFAAGAGAGVYAITRMRRMAEVLTPDGLADRLAGLSLGVHLFSEEVKAGMVEKENELHRHRRLALHGTTPRSPAAGSPTTRKGND